MEHPAVEMKREQTHIEDLRGAAMLLLILICLACSQWLFGAAGRVSSGGMPLLAALFFEILAVVLLFLAKRTTPVPTATSNLTFVPAGNLNSGIGSDFMNGLNWRSGMLILSILLSTLLLQRLPNVQPTGSYLIATILWASAILTFLTAVAPTWESVRSRWRMRIQPDPHHLILIGILLLALTVRILFLDAIPFTLSGDEGSQGLEAIRVIEGEIRNPFATGWLGVPTMSFFFNSVTIRFLGPTVAALRLPWGIVGTATVALAYLLVKRLKGKQVALISAALLATYHYHIHFSRLGSNQIADPFFLTLALLFLSRAIDRESRFDWAVTGAVAGIAFYFYAGARLTVVIVAAVIGYGLILEPRQFWQRHGPKALAGVGSFLTVGGPIIQYGFRFPQEFNARLNQVGIIQSGWLARETGIRGESVGAILWDQFQRAALAFNLYPDRTVWYGLRQPLLGPLFGSLFLLGLGYACLRILRRTGDRQLAPMVAWWWGGILLGGMMTESPPSSQRLITLAVPVCFFIALAIWELATLAEGSLTNVPRKGVVALMVFSFSFYSLKTYLVDYSPQRIYGGPHAELATELAPILNEMKADHRIYFLGAPWMYWGFATLPYLVPDADAVDLTEPFAAYSGSDLVRSDKRALFVVIPQRAEELEEIMALYPDGEASAIKSPVDDRVLVSLYESG